MRTPIYQCTSQHMVAAEQEDSSAVDCGPCCWSLRYLFLFAFSCYFCSLLRQDSCVSSRVVYWTVAGVSFPGGFWYRVRLSAFLLLLYCILGPRSIGVFCWA